MTETTEKKRRKTRRNYERELRAIEAYCRSYVEVLEEEPRSTDRYHEGKIIAFQQVLAKIATGGKNGRE